MIHMGEDKPLFFGLKMVKSIQKDGKEESISMQTQSGGISNVEAALFIKAWAEAILENATKPIKDNLLFKPKGDE